MPRRPARRALFAVALTALAFAALFPVLSAQAAVPVRIMPLGDSITGSPGCWRALLWSRMQNAGVTNVDFVGTLPPQGCGFTYDGENEGHGGILATNMADQNQLPPWLSATRPDIVIMHLGTNDVWSARDPAVILAAFGKLVDQMRASNPAMKILVAKIIPVNPPSCTECAARTVTFNNMIPGWASSKNTAQSPITVVDQWTGFNTATDTTDGVHPNAAGDQKISDRWFAPLVAAVNNTTTPTTTPPTTRPTTPPTTPPTTRPTTPPTTNPTGTGCTATYAITNQWPGGFGANVTVRNGSAQTSAWAVAWTFANGQTITQIWNAADTPNGASHTARNLSYNGNLAPNATTSFGFNGSWNGTNSVPTLSCTRS